MAQAETTRVIARMPNDVLRDAQGRLPADLRDMSTGRLVRYALALLAGRSEPDARALAVHDLQRYYPRHTRHST